jgi:putative heme-binding domain-containing protein
LALRNAVLASLGKLESAKVAELVLAGYAKYEPELQPKAIELLTQRPAWSKALLKAIGEGRISAAALNANQVARLQASPDEELKKLVAAKWGTIRTERNPQREQVVAQMRTAFKSGLGDPHKGAAVFAKVCGQCHKIHGEGQEVGPDITLNGRASFEQLLSNVFDPSLVIGAAYQARQVVTVDGRVLTGLVTEENDQRVVLKIQGGKIETIARDDIEEMQTSPLSLMPEGLENQLKPEELSDLFAFLALDRPPSDPEAKYLPGAPVGK